MCRCISPPHEVTGIKLHYIRLLAGPELVLSSTAPANNPTEQRACIHHYRDFLRLIFCFSLRLLIHSFIHFSSLGYFLSFPSMIVFFSFSPPKFSCYCCILLSPASSLGKWCILLSSCLLGSGWKSGIERSPVLLSGFPHRVYNPLDVLEGGTVFEQPYSMYSLCKVSRNRKKQWWCICRSS